MTNSCEAENSVGTNELFILNLRDPDYFAFPTFVLTDQVRIIVYNLVTRRTYLRSLKGKAGLK